MGCEVFLRTLFLRFALANYKCFELMLLYMTQYTVLVNCSKLLKILQIAVFRHHSYFRQNFRKKKISVNTYHVQTLHRTQTAIQTKYI